MVMRKSEANKNKKVSEKKTQKNPNENKLDWNGGRWEYNATKIILFRVSLEV
jgi:hypothetical protein